MPYSTEIKSQTYKILGASLGALMTLSANAQAQDKIEWKQTFQYDDSQTIPEGLSLDILGIKIGDSYEVAKAKLERIAQENGGTEQVQITQTHFRLPVSGGASLETKFPSQLRLSTHSDEITVHVSSPASGAQVFGISRLMSFHQKSEQVKISSFLPKIAKKYGAEPKIRADHGGPIYYRIQYDNRVAITPPEDVYGHCGASSMHNWGKTESDLKKLNPTDKCDIIIDIQFNRGISADHASLIWFHVADLERAKATIGADYQYFRDYLDALKSGDGDEPKL